MNSSDPEPFEAELKRLRPAQPPPEVVSSILRELSASTAQAAAAKKSPRAHWNWSLLLRWLVPAGAAAALCATLYVQRQSVSRPQQPQAAISPAPLLKADKIEIDRQLIADFDAIANLPSGQPVRFRCEQWMDKIQWRDSAKGLVIEQTTPRLEIVPIRFETY